MEQITNREDALDLIGELVEKYHIDRSELMSALSSDSGFRTRGDLIFQVQEANICLLIAVEDVLPRMKLKLRNAEIPDLISKVQTVIQHVLKELMREDIEDIVAGQTAKGAE